VTTIVANQTSYQITGLNPESLYSFRVRAYNAFAASGYSNISQNRTFALPQGTITRELWENVNGWSVADIPFSQTPSVSTLTTIETAEQSGDYYGQRIRGYIIPPTTGQYTFWIASDDRSELWLSTNELPASKALIASVTSYTGYRIWNTLPSQKSAAKILTAGVRYYVEVLHKEGNQNDNLSVWWSKPGESTTAPTGAIPPSVLSPYIIEAIPIAPANLTATALSATQIDLRWTDNSNNELGFRIERSSGGGEFVELGTAPANATLYHDAGLSAVTQYQYRIRSFNNLGNSTTYSNTVAAITLESMPVTPSPQGLLAFAVYSSERTTLSSRALFNGGGAVGSNDTVDIFSQAVVNGNVLSGGDVYLRSQAEVHGTVSAAGSVTLEAGATADNIVEGANVGIITIPQKTSIPLGVIDSTIPPGKNTILPPGYYRHFMVSTGGTLTLSKGQYTFASLYLQPDAKIVLDVAMNDMADVDIEGDVEFSDRSEVIFKDKGYVPFIRFYTNDNNTVRIGCNVKLNGTLIAPHGNIGMFTGAQCTGALYAKTIRVEPDAIIFSDMTDPEKDSDGDGVANILEVVMGTDLHNANSYYPIAIPSRALIDNSQDVTITYDYSVFFPDYAFAKTMSATFPAGSLRNPNIPLIITVGNAPQTNPGFTMAGYDVLGRYIAFNEGNGIVGNAEVTLEIPKRAPVASTSFIPYQYDGTAWEEIPETRQYASADFSETIKTSTTDAIVFAGAHKNGSKTLYFDGGYVYSDNAQAAARYIINITDLSQIASDVENISLSISYTDLATSPGVSKVTPPIPLTKSPATANEEESYKLYGQFVNNGPMRIDFCTITATFADGTSAVYKQNGVPTQTIQSAQTMIVHLDAPLVKLVDATQNKNNWFAMYYSPSDVTFESMSFGEGRMLNNRDENGDDQYTYEYYLTDHLGSTRMVLNDAEEVTEAIHYQPYGTMASIGGLTGALDVREKFTTKEFDEEGAPMGKLDFEMTFNFGTIDPNLGTTDPVDLDPAKWNAIGVYYTDPTSPKDDAAFDIIPLIIDEATNTAIASASLTYTDAKKIKWIHIILNGVNIGTESQTFDVSCAITPIEEDVGPNGRMEIRKVVGRSSELTGTIGEESVLAKDYLSYPAFAYNGANGIGKFYFGARYFDPELGVWGSRDAAGQFFNPYAYSTNPVLMVDADGNFFLLPIALIGFGVGYVRAGLRTHNWGLSSVKAGLWTGAGAALAFSPAAPYVLAGMMVAQGTITAVSNKASGTENFAQFGYGAMEGLLDFGNMATMGLANKPISDASGYLRGSAYNQAYGITGERARINIDESRKMNKLFGAYPGQGTLIKYGSDLAWRSFHGGGNDRYMYARAKRLYGENPKGAAYKAFIKNYGKQYTSGEYYHGQAPIIPQLGHAAFGTITSHEAWYDGFETYGEPWVKWETQDEWDDHGIFYYLYRLYDENKNGDWGDYAND